MKPSLRLFFPLLLPILPLLLCGLCLAQDQQDRNEKNVQAEPAAPISQSINKLGMDMLLYQLKNDPMGNHCVCPLPIASTAAALAEGAAGETKAQLLKPFEGSDHPFPETSELGEKIRHQGVIQFTGFFNNSKFPLNESYKERVEKAGIASFYQIDADKKGIEPVRKNINQIISEQTKKRIANFFSPRMINPEFAVIIADTVYMNAAWSIPFEYYTSNKPFFQGKSLPPSKGFMMHDPHSTKFLIRKNQSIYWKDYNNSSLRMIAVLPPIDQKLHQFLSSSSPDEWLNAILEKESAPLNGLPPSAEIVFPKFSLSSPVVNMKSFMQSQGIEECFVRGKADFSPMMAPGNLNPWFVSEIFQKTFIQMDKEGTLAASAAISMLDPFCGLGPKTIQFNRPFVYCIIDTKTKAVLFLGVINNPFSK